MRHRVQARHFNRDANHRKALLTNLIRFLIEHGEIVTTREKAKEVKRLADKIISKAQTDDLATRRQLHKIFGKRDVVNTLIESVAKQMSDRKSGFTTTSIVGSRRGDNTLLVKISLVKQPETKGLVKAKSAKVEKKVEVKTPTKVAKKTEVKKVTKTSKTVKKSDKK
jgi:large subunit ribosomal protein L17